MAKSTLKLIGVYEAWSRNVREGRLTRANGSEATVLVRVHDDLAATPEQIARLREDARLLGRLQHESVLRLEHVSAVGGKIGEIFEGFECASAGRILRVLRARNQVLPARAAVETAAAVGLALDEALRIVDGDRAVFHPGPVPDDVLVDTHGRVKLAGFRVHRPGDPPGQAPRGYLAPEGAGGPAAGTYLIGALLVELLSGEAPPEAAAEPERHEAAIRRALIRVLARPGDTPGEGVVQAIRQALAHEPAIRGAPGAFGRALRELAVALASPGLRAWAPGSIASIQRFSPDVRAAGGAVLPAATEEAPRVPLGTNQTIAPVDGGASLGVSRASAPPAERVPLGGNQTIAPPDAGRAILAGAAAPGRSVARAPLPDAGSRSFERGGRTMIPASDADDSGGEATLIGGMVPPEAGGGMPAPPVRPTSPLPVSTRPGPPEILPSAETGGRMRAPQPGPGAEPPMKRAVPEVSAVSGAALPADAGRAPLPNPATAPHPRGAAAPANLARSASAPSNPASAPPRAPAGGAPSPRGPALKGPSPAGPAPQRSGPAVVPARRPMDISRAGPELEPIGEHDESEATVVAGRVSDLPSFEEDPLGPTPERRGDGPALASSASPPSPPSPRHSPAIHSPPPSVLDEEPEPAARSGWLLTFGVAAVALCALALVVVFGGYLFLRSPIEEEILTDPGASGMPAETPAAETPAAETPAAETPAAETPAAEPAPAPVPAAPVAAPVPPVAAPRAPPASAPATASASSRPSAPAASAPAASAPPKGSASSSTSSRRPPVEPEPEADDDAPVRISVRAPDAAPPASDSPDSSASVRISSAPAASAPAASAPAASTAPSEVEPPAPVLQYFKVGFTAVDPSVSSIEVKCSAGSGVGSPSVTLEQVPKGNCRVTGRGGDSPLITMVTVVADRSYSCFADRAPSCK